MDKKELLTILEKETEPLGEENKYHNQKVILELKKLKFNLGIIKGELFENGVITNRGSFTLPIETDQPNATEGNSFWDSMQDGENKFYVFTLDSREKTLPKKLKDFFNRTLEEGTINLPFFSLGRKSE